LTKPLYSLRLATIMPRSSISLGKISGIDIRLDYSWFIIFLLVTWSLTVGYFPLVYPNWSVGQSIAVGLITSLLFFASILAHELMHSIIAQRSGIPVGTITLFIFGGISQISKEPESPNAEFRIAIAGPATSIVLGGIFEAIMLLAPDNLEALVAVSFWLGLINLSLGLFNLLPAFPMDGGRVLRSIIWRRSHNLRHATKVASVGGQVISSLFILGGIWLLFSGLILNGVWLILIGWFIFDAASSSYRQFNIQRVLQGHRVKEIMIPDCATISPTLTVEELANDYILPSGKRCFVVGDKDKPLGLVTLTDVSSVSKENRLTKSVTEIMTPFEKLKRVSPDDDLHNAMKIITEEGLNQLPVIEDGKVIGMLTRENLLSFISAQQSLGA